MASVLLGCGRAEPSVAAPARPVLVQTLDLDRHPFPETSDLTITIDGVEGKNRYCQLATPGVLRWVCANRRPTKFLATLAFAVMIIFLANCTGQNTGSSKSLGPVKLEDSNCGNPMSYCAPTTYAPLSIPSPPIVSSGNTFVGAGTMVTMPWSNAPAMRVTDGNTRSTKTSWGLFYAGQADPTVRSPMLGARASSNCNNGSPTCFYVRFMKSAGQPDVFWMDGGTDPTRGDWKVGRLCVDNRLYTRTKGYALGPAYNYSAKTGNTWHAPKFLQTPGSEGILLDVELRTASGQRNGGLTGDDAWLVARDLTKCNATTPVPESPVVDFNAVYPAFDPSHTTETQGYGPGFSEATARARSDSNGNVTLIGGTFCVTLSNHKGNDEQGTSAACYDAMQGGRWYDAIQNTAGGEWGDSGTVTQTCVDPKGCSGQRSPIVSLKVTDGPNPVAVLSSGNKTFWDFSLNQNSLNVGGKEAVGIDNIYTRQRTGADNIFVARTLPNVGAEFPLTFPAPNGWGTPSTFNYHIVYPGDLYFGSDQGVLFLSTTNSKAGKGCVHDVGGTCGIYGVALDGSGTTYSFFPTYASEAAKEYPDAQMANFSVYIDGAGTTWVFWGSDWMGNLGCADGVTQTNCSATGTHPRTDVFAGLLQ